MGKLKGEDTMTVQSVLFPKEDGWTMDGAKEWIKEHPDINKATVAGDEKEAAIEVSKINKDTINRAIETLKDVLKAREIADNQVKDKGRIPLVEGGKKIYVKVLNRAIRELLETKHKI
jgi:uncharacterized protein YjaG (DUF416 family)